MKVYVCNNSVVAALAASLMLITAFAAPMHEGDEDQSENALVGREADTDMAAPWDAIDTAALRKLLLQLDSEERMNLNRATRSWPQQEQRGWNLRALDGRVARQWRADKRQVRFRQCYFNPISCFRK